MFNFSNKQIESLEYSLLNKYKNIQLNIMVGQFQSNYFKIY